MENINEASKALMTPEQNAEYEKLQQAGAGFVGAKRGGFYVPTIQLNNSDKTFKKHGIALGNFFLREKKNQEEIITDMGKAIDGVILKVSYSIKSVFDPDKQVNYYSREFDNFFEDTITVIDGNSKEILYEGDYKQWKEENQIISKRGNRNDFNLNVHLYILKDGFVEGVEPRVYRLTFKGRSMSEWFAYTNGDKEKGIESIYSQGIQPHNAIHTFLSAEDITPKNEKYWFIHFSVDTKLNLESLRKVVAMQQELDKQINILRHKKEVVPRPERLGAPDNSAIRDDEVAGGEGDIVLEDVPF